MKNRADVQFCVAGFRYDRVTPTLAVLAFATCLGCEGGSRAAGADTTSTGRSASSTTSISPDSLTRATAADLEQILFSQDAPADFPQEYWTLGRRIYDDRHYAPLWTGPEATSDKRRVRMGLLCRADDEGIALSPPLAAAPRRVPVSTRRVDSLARRDLQLTFALVRYLSVVAHGGVAPAAVHAPWNVAPPAGPSDSAIAAMVESADTVAIAQLIPASPQYALLSNALGRLLDIESRGGWGVVTDSTVLRPGSRGAAVERLRTRLVLSRDMDAADSAGKDYSPAVVRGVRSFQRRVGIHADGRVGPATRAALNVSARDRARIVAANLERYRWIPRSPVGQTVVLDVATGRATVMRHGVVVLRTNLGVSSSCTLPLPPVLADTISRVTNSNAVLRIRLAGGDSVVIRAADKGRNVARACLVADDYAALRDALVPRAGAYAPATELYMVLPTAYVSGDSALMYRPDASGADARLGAVLNMPEANQSAMCDRLQTSP